MTVIDSVGKVGFFKSDKWLFSLMIVSAFVSLVAAFVLSVDALVLAGNPGAVLGCDINAVISCGTVAASWQASVLGFPNAFIGLMCEPVMITIAVAGLTGVRFKRWFMAVVQAFYLCATVFALWLFYQSAFVIQAFCPWCLLVTVGTTITFFTLLRFNVIHDNLFLKNRLQSFAKFAVRVSADTAVEVLLLVAVFAVIFINYGTAIFLP